MKPFARQFKSAVVFSLLTGAFASSALTFAGASHVGQKGGQPSYGSQIDVVAMSDSNRIAGCVQRVNQEINTQPGLRESLLRNGISRIEVGAGGDWSGKVGKFAKRYVLHRNGPFVEQDDDGKISAHISVPRDTLKFWNWFRNGVKRGDSFCEAMAQRILDQARLLNAENQAVAGARESGKQPSQDANRRIAADGGGGPRNAENANGNDFPEERTDAPEEDGSPSDSGPAEKELRGMLAELEIIRTLVSNNRTETARAAAEVRLKTVSDYYMRLVETLSSEKDHMAAFQIVNAINMITAVAKKEPFMLVQREGVAYSSIHLQGWKDPSQSPAAPAVEAATVPTEATVTAQANTARVQTQVSSPAKAVVALSAETGKPEAVGDEWSEAGASAAVDQKGAVADARLKWSVENTSSAGVKVSPKQALARQAEQKRKLVEEVNALEIKRKSAQARLDAENQSFWENDEDVREYWTQRATAEVEKHEKRVEAAKAAFELARTKALVHAGQKGSPELVNALQDIEAAQLEMSSALKDWDSRSDDLMAATAEMDYRNHGDYAEKHLGPIGHVKFNIIKEGWDSHMFGIDSKVVLEKDPMATQKYISESKASVELDPALKAALLK